MNFSRWAKPYHWMTHHALWRDGMAELAKQLPPSAAQLRLLDISSGTGISLQNLHHLRPDLLPIACDLAWGMVAYGKQRYPNLPFLQADALRLPFADNSMDAVLIQRLYYFLPQKTELLAESLRVLRAGGRLIMVNPAASYSPWQALREWRHPKAVLDLFAWHSVAQKINRYTPEGIAREMEAVGFARILAEPILNGWAMMSRGEKPHLESASTLERVAVAASDARGEILRGEQIQQLRGRFVHVLIRQTPHLPAWKLSPDQPLEWSAVGVVEQGEFMALAFSALPKAVQFMQRAVLENWVQDVNKVAKFSLTTASRWDFPLWLNPEFDPQRMPQFKSIDPHSAEAPDE